MAPAYRSIEDDQIVVSDEPRPDLEALARWHQISDEDAEALLAAAAERAEQPDDGEVPEDEDLAALGAFIRTSGLTAADVLAILTKAPDVVESTSGTENEPPAEIPGDPAEDGADPAPAAVPDENGAAASETLAASTTKAPRGRKKAGDA